MSDARTALLGTCLGIAASSITALAGAEHTRQHGAHEHGAAMLQVALEGTELRIELESPAMNIVGFEHQPRNPREVQAIQQALAALGDPNRVFALPAEAKCEAGAVEIHGPLTEAGHGPGGHKDKEPADVHSDLQVRYRFTCAQVDALRTLDVRLFALFPKMQRLRVELIGPKGQSATNLSRDRAKILF